jgi:hypothetical protein
MSSIPEDWVPTESEVPADHWSKSAEWLEYKRNQEKFQKEVIAPYKAANTLAPFQRVGTVNQEKRKLTTHEIQMQGLQQEWIDPNPPAEEQDTVITVGFLENLANKLQVEKPVIDPAITEAGKALEENLLIGIKKAIEDASSR